VVEGVPEVTVESIGRRVGVVEPAPLDPDEPSAARARAGLWVPAFAALFAVAVIAAALLVGALLRSDGQQVDIVGDPDGQISPEITEQSYTDDHLVGLNVVVRQPAPDPMDIGGRTVMALGIVDGSGELVLPVQVSPPTMGDGAGMLTAFSSLDVAAGGHRLRLWTYPCQANGQCLGDLGALTASPTDDMNAARCEVAVDVGPEPQEVFVALADDGTCELEQPVDEMQAATERLARQLATGWVPYGGSPEIEGTSTPTGSWTRAGPTEQVDCDHRPDARGIPRLLRCPVYDEPDGAVIGYRYNGLGYVPVELAETFDHGRALLEQRGCDPFADPACA
jgi:hypothetical protein